MAKISETDRRLIVIEDVAKRTLHLLMQHMTRQEERARAAAERADALSEALKTPAGRQDAMAAQLTVQGERIEAQGKRIDTLAAEQRKTNDTLNVILAKLDRPAE